MAVPVAVPVPGDSFLDSYARRGAFTDCYAAQVEGAVSLQAFVEAFYTTRLFKLERWLLNRLLRHHATDAQARQLAQGSAERFSAWRVERRSPHQILLDAGQTRSWLAVSGSDQPGHTVLLFGSAVVPTQPGGRFGVAFHLLLGFHRLYSKRLLSAAGRRVLVLRGADSAG